MLDHAISCRTDPPVGAIPIDDDQWSLFVGRLQDVRDSFVATTEVVDAAVESETFNDLRAAAEMAASALLAADRACYPGFLFTHPHRSELIALHKLIGESARSWSASLIGIHNDSLSGRLSGEPAATSIHAPTPIEEVLRQLQATGEHQVEDSWMAAYSVDSDSLRDSNGAFSSSLLIAQFHGRFDEFQQRLDRLYAPFGFPRLEPIKAVSFSRVFLDLRDPTEAVQAALHVADLISDRFAKDPDHTALVLRGLLDNVDISYANSIMIQDTQARIGSTVRLDKKAMLHLEMYRRMAEGQMKPWAWVLVCLHTGTVGGAPTLSQLGDRLRATNDPVAQSFAECITAEPRNAAAHEDYHWDTRRRRLVGGGIDIDPDALTQLTVRGHGLMCGAELGWAFACATTPALTTAMGKASDRQFSSILQIDAALSRFATNNLRVDDWEFDLDELAIRLSELAPGGYNQCAQAMLEAGLALPEIGRFSVRVPSIDGPAMVVDRYALNAMLPAWFESQRLYSATPTAIFVPVMFQSRLLVETPEEAVRSILWLALNEAVLFIESYRKSPPADRATGLNGLSRGLAMTYCALETCVNAAPDHRPSLIGRAYRAIRGAATYADAAGSDPTRLGQAGAENALARLETKIYALWEDLPPCAPFPTLNATPLQLASERVGSVLPWSAHY